MDATFTLFADDTTLSLTVDSLVEAILGMEAVQSDIKAWSDASGLLLNQSKIQQMVFSVQELERNQALLLHSPDEIRFPTEHMIYTSDDHK
ncbi:unnamed protein product [Acanthoscelides obtectus]|uniref:Uncharacterized protein n=1 Tax=Acanthoscelides obtectus TaxID=200917 RepID=A0A9P0P4V7_ACAOB|nr:unnamed protein product [Acanthoscelides obtectus]CAK1657055.1 hypothetical protein AOBTE_LOCUS20091 [Acanthoscelides obtectus]